MKILYLTASNGDVNRLPNHCKAEYLSDLLFYGLRELLGNDVIDFPKKEHLYYPFEQSHELWGKGFSYAGLIKEDNVDRSNIEAKLKCDFFDLVVISMHNSLDHHPTQFYHQFGNIYYLNTGVKIAVVDGKDSSEVMEGILDYSRKPFYFKREISTDRKDIIPISFAIPKEKISGEVCSKQKYLANILPADHSHPNRKTHKYVTEEDYYNDYATSYFALTCKMAGWDCMRHYEIMANGCIPIFTDIENCPAYTLTILPKEMLSFFKTLPGIILKKKIFTKNEIDEDCFNIDISKFNHDETLEYCENIRSYTERFLTTERLAEYFLRKIYAI